MVQIKPDVSMVLKNNGYSVTKQRLAVFSMLDGREPLTMYELYDLAKGQLDKASLYRIIELFEKLGIVQRINIGWKYKIELSDKFSEHHHHLTCLRCNKIVAINEDALESFVTELSKTYSFTTLDHQIELQGYCSDCSEKYQAGLESK
jgi:Fur family ferric uptake transcriptional regulator